MWPIFQIEFYSYSPSRISKMLWHFCFIHTEQHLRIETQQWSVAIHHERLYGLHFSTPTKIWALSTHTHTPFSQSQNSMIDLNDSNSPQRQTSKNLNCIYRDAAHACRHKLCIYFPNEIKIKDLSFSVKPSKICCLAKILFSITGLCQYTLLQNLNASQSRKAEAKQKRTFDWEQKCKITM